MTYRDAPEFRDENERLIWCTAFATHELHRPSGARFQDIVEVNDYTGPLGKRCSWHENARHYADEVLAGYRESA